MFRATFTLTKAQVRALRMLRTKPRETTKHACYDYIAGITAAALCRHELARRATVQADGRALVEITDKGRQALAALEPA